MIPLPLLGHFNKALCDPNDSCEIPLPRGQCSGGSLRRDGLDFWGWDTSASWQRLGRFGLQVDRVVGHASVAVGVVKGAVEVFVKVGV